ncbi:tetratricopeptide repeat protein [Azospirillum brasilense]|uniref:O-linked N-acetylglucosamine transferase, SPINDLY family protein n=1 Tax=Azospirillum argentinense TaxID=2970906 RepID=UPI00190B58C2|nr:glycosyltransferase family 41 protein [Azospirillum argentinense]MBK3800197.1 tetratricopeptide repeat protein [Azospirillum argentinense]
MGNPAETATVRSFAAALEHHRAGRLDAAEAVYRAILRDDPGHAHANNNLAILLRGTGRWEEAAACYRRAVAALPDDAPIRSNLSCALADLDRLAEALAAVRVALSLSPDYADAWFNAGNLLKTERQPERALAAYRRAVRLKPGMGGAHSNMGDVHRDLGESSRAVDCYRAAIQAQPDLPQPVVNLGEALKEQGRITEAIAVFQSGVERHPDLALLHSNLLLALHYTPWVPPEVIARAHAQWNERHARPLMPRNRRFASDRNPDRRLRVGYVSPDFRAHACAHFIEPLLREHDRGAVEIFCYATSNHHDAITERMRSLADGWRSLTALDDAAAAALVERDRIDILVDLAGHTAHSRPLLFARKPAPIQVAWLGYPDTTGMTAIDHRLTDAVADPPGLTDAWHAERLVRLPKGFLAFQPLRFVTARDEPPALANGFVTFGSFNNAAKVTPEVMRVWSAILARVPSARLCLKSRAFGDAPTRERYLRQFAGNGVDPGRVDLLPPMDVIDHHLQAYDRIDIGLDPFPYNGTTTTCEALWMGVPVITLAGRHHVARVGASLLTRCGLTEFIATDEAGYIETAVALAGDTGRLAALRRGMTKRMERSALSDHRGFAAAVEAAYRAMWHSWLGRERDAAAER